jgi:outer membrane protein TolC
MVKNSIILMLLAGGSLFGQGILTLEESIQRAWSQQAGLRAGQAMVDRAEAEAGALGSLCLPTLTAGVGVTRTDEPMMAFGMKLNQSRISQMDFMPSALNHPDPITGAGASLTLSQPLYAGGRLNAASRAGSDMAKAEAASQAHRRQQVALAVVQAYFGTQVAEQGVNYAEDTLRQAQETERFVQSRVDQGLILKSEGDRARAFRAQSEAGVVEAKQRLASARSALALLMGSENSTETLSTPVNGPVQELPSQTGGRGDLEAARLQAEAAREGLSAQRGLLKPEVGLTLTAGTARKSWNEGGNWTSASVGAKWTFSFTEQKRIQASRASVRAAELNQQWQQQQASREVGEAQRAVETAQARMSYAKVALEASESVRTIRTARHREGLLLLVEVMDAETGLSGARTMLLNSQLEWRISRAQLALALGQPIENVKE